jgi:glyoxylase I family protein
MIESPIVVGTVHHVSFRVDDLGAALVFYRDTLGCRPIPRPDAITVRGAWLQAGETQVHLIEAPASEATGTPPARINPVASHVAFRIADLGAAEAALSLRGVTVMRGPSSEVAQVFVRDPSGNLVELSAC